MGSSWELPSERRGSGEAREGFLLRETQSQAKGSHTIGTFY